MEILQALLLRAPLFPPAAETMHRQRSAQHGLCCLGCVASFHWVDQRRHVRLTVNADAPVALSVGSRVHAIPDRYYGLENPAPQSLGIPVSADKVRGEAARSRKRHEPRQRLRNSWYGIYLTRHSALGGGQKKVKEEEKKKKKGSRS